MLFDINIDAEQDVLEIRTTVIEQLKNGGLILTEWSSESASAKKVIGIPLRELLQECNRFLRLINPDKYGKRITRTVPRFL